MVEDIKKEQKEKEEALDREVKARERQLEALERKNKALRRAITAEEDAIKAEEDAIKAEKYAIKAEERKNKALDEKKQAEEGATKAEDEAKKAEDEALTAVEEALTALNDERLATNAAKIAKKGKKKITEVTKLTEEEIRLKLDTQDELEKKTDNIKLLARDLEEYKKEIEELINEAKRLNMLEEAWIFEIQFEKIKLVIKNNLECLMKSNKEYIKTKAITISFETKKLEASISQFKNNLENG